MKVSISWLKELVNLKIPMEELLRLLPLRTIGLKETNKDFLELDMKGYNRADLLSMRGVAFEIAAITDSPLKYSDVTDGEYTWVGKNLPTTPVTIENYDLSSVQVVAKIENLKVEHSSDTWVKKLSDCGMRSVDNITDVTNLVTLEYGQPLHSFDARTVQDETINVRLAKDEEEIITLDGKLRKFTSHDIVLADTKGPLDVAGVMGGKDTEIKDSTTTILLSASLFDFIHVRRTASRLNLHSEASRRFQHGLTKRRLLQALDAAIKMYEQMGGKLTAITLVGNLTDETKTVTLRQEKLNSLMGIDIKPEGVEKYLTKLGFKTASHTTSGNVVWRVEIPYWRLDINIEEDLIEEVARMYGYEKIPAKALEGKEPEETDQSLFDTIRSLKKALCEVGLTEVQTYSFYPSDVLNNLDWNKENLVKISNPISSETEYLREDIWPNLLEVAVKNIKHGYDEVAIFELGKVYNVNKNSPAESYRISLCLANTNNNTIQELYQIFQNSCSNLKGCNVKLTVESEKMGEYEKKYFHPARFAFLDRNGKTIGGIAEVHTKFTDKFGIKQRVAVLEFELQLIVEK